MTALVAGATVGVAPPAMAEVVGAGTPGAVAGSYIAVFKDGVAADSDRLARKYSGTVTHRYDHALRGFAAKLDERSARRLAADPAVAYVQQNRVVRKADEQDRPSSWGLDRIDQRFGPLDHTYHYSTKATGVTAYVVDTGIRITHDDFGGRAVWGTNTIGDGKDEDCDGHGTHVSGTIGGTEYGVAKGVKLVAVKVLDCDGSGTSESVAAGLDWVAANHVSGPAVANMSLGGDAPDLVMENAVKRVIADGVLVAVAAGNQDEDACRHSPALVPEALTVGAVNDGDQRSSFSNYGSCVDLFAPGEYIWSASSGYNQDFDLLSGTSMATPHVTGAAALLLARDPGLTPAQLSAGMLIDATKDVVTDPQGSPNRLLVVNTGYRPGYPFVNDPGVRAGRVGTPMSTQLSVVGGTAPYTWTTTALPPGLTLNATTGLISGTPTTTVVNRSVSVTAKDKNNRTGAVTFRMFTTPPGWQCSSKGQKFRNPGFEDGREVGNGWDKSRTLLITTSSGDDKPRTGTWAAYFAGAGFSWDDSLSQEVAIPADCPYTTFSFWVRTTTAEPASSGPVDTLTVTAGTKRLAVISNLDGKPGWVQRTYDVGSMAGQTVRFSFYSGENDGGPTAFDLDDTALNVS
ncbi:S8 family serine peptidase [Actinokineospora auranticolor]|uniref:S8 family serine peptidase n=1 Tax=Actinokineospora auranticolor TaxID=155976 RepID=UPI001FE5D398|nr:S8 family serine peptidase [Actinokineospora auranticolor]